MIAAIVLSFLFGGSLGAFVVGLIVDRQRAQDRRRNVVKRWGR